MLAEVAELMPSDPAWKAKWTVITENIEHHAGEEESDLFPKVRSHTKADWRKHLGDELDRRKGQLGAPTLADRTDFTVEQLHHLAPEQQIPGRSTMSTDEPRATVSPV